MKRGDLLFWLAPEYNEEGEVVAEDGKVVMKTYKIIFQHWGTSTVFRDYRGQTMMVNETRIFAILQDSLYERIISIDPTQVYNRPPDTSIPDPRHEKL